MEGMDVRHPLSTLGELVEAYLAHLRADGKSPGTLFSYGIELRCALVELGVECQLGQLTPERIEAYYACDRVTKTRDGRPKSVAGVAKTRRVLRLALQWAAEEARACREAERERTPAPKRRRAAKPVADVEP